jgi:hypothetical protein
VFSRLVDCEMHRGANLGFLIGASGLIDRNFVHLDNIVGRWCACIAVRGRLLNGCGL